MWFIQAHFKVSWAIFLLIGRFLTKYRKRKDLVVSLTSIPSRFFFLEKTVKGLLCQTIIPNAIRIYIEKEYFEVLSKVMNPLSKFGVEVIGVEPGLRSANMIIPEISSRQEDLEPLIIYLNDDVIYPRKLLESMLDESKRQGNTSIICNWAQFPVFDENHVTLPYKDWPDSHEWHGRRVFATPLSVAAILVPRKVLPRQFSNRKLFQKLAQYNDDLWLFTHAIVNDIPIIMNSVRLRIPVLWPGSQNEALWHVNVVQGRNDSTFSELLRYFPSLRETLLTRPELSLVKNKH